MAFPDELKHEILSKGWSQKDVADKVGTSEFTVNRWLKEGQPFPSPYFRQKLAIAFGKSVEELGLIPPIKEKDRNASTSVILEPSSDIPIASVYDPLLPIALVRSDGLIGRDSLLTHLKQRICAGESLAPVALDGLPGIGKTALAVALASDPDIKKHFNGGILWVGLGTNPNVLGLLSRWGTLLEISSTALEDPISQEAWGRALRTAIGRRRLLLVIDDAWNAQEALAFRIGGPNCAHLLTTRNSQVAFAFAQKEGIFRIPELAEVDGVSLLARFAPEVVAQNIETAHKLVHSVGALPLALYVLGKYLGAQNYSGQPRRLQAALEHLQVAEQRLRVSMPISPVERPPNLPKDVPLSLYAAIDVSDQNLGEQAREALRALSILPAKPNSFSEEVACAVAAVHGEVLDTLSDAGLLEQGGPHRYMLHQTIADYARTHLVGTAAQERLMIYGIEYIERSSTDEEVLERESSTILAALQAAFALDRQDYLVRGISAIAHFLQLRSSSPLLDLVMMMQQWEHQVAFDTHLNEGLALAQQKNDREQIYRLLISLGWMASVREDYTRAEVFYQEALTLARQEQKRDQISALLAGLGWLAEKRQDYVQAEKYLQEEIDLARLEGDAKRLSVLLTSLGWIVSRQGDYKRAKPYGQEGLTLALSGEGKRYLCEVLMCLASMAMSWEDYSYMEFCVQKALPLARQEGNSDLLCIILAGQGWLADQQHGDDIQAQACYEEALKLARSEASHEVLVWILTFHAWFAYKHKDLVVAKRDAEEGVDRARQLRHQEMMFRLIILLGRVAELHGDDEQAQAHYKEGLTLIPLYLYQTLEVSQFVSRFLSWVGELQLKHEQAEAAADTFKRLLELASGDSTDRLNMAKAQYGLARVAALQGDKSKARKLAEASLAHFELIGSPRARVVREWLEVQNAS